MNRIDRRTILASGALALAGATAQSRPAGAQAGPKAMFPVPATTIPIVGETDVFQVRRIYCIGRNYAAHAIERGSDPTREPPFFFQKPTDAIQNVAVGTVADHPYPSLTKNYHHEVELVAALKSGGANIPAEKALEHVYGYALGLDMTRRDLQSRLRKFEQVDKWSFCLKAAMIAANRRDHEQTTAPEPQPGFQGEGGACRRQGRPDDSSTGRALRRPPQSGDGLESTA
jgi:2-keto-4-pentenoate hydratase/2-oxohepta-3-ene-1,7-dioic acid hydratase in catechol pathway